MSSHRHFHSFGEELAIAVLIITFVCLAVSLYVACRILAYIYFTFEKYKAKSLYYSLAVCIGFGLVGGILAALTQRPGLLGVLCPGVLQLVLVCAIVRRQQATTFMNDRLDFNIVEAMTKRKWFTDDPQRIAA